MKKAVVAHHDTPQGSVKTYTIGFVGSLALTLLAYIIADHQVASGWTLIYLLAVLAISQLFVQLVFFLHLGRESRPRWNLTVFSFALMVVVILVFGSLWIMKHLNYAHQMTPAQTNQYIIKDEGYSSND